MFDVCKVIKTKRDAGKLSRSDIEEFVRASVSHEIADYQISAMLMAMFINKLDREETIDLTRAMKDSGDTLDLSGIKGIKCDKHSTGGVGDKTTLICAPLAAACGVPIAKMSGRGLGFTGGTVDKLESIPGYKTMLAEDAFIDQVNSCGISLIGQTKEVATADKIFYALRDVTATIEDESLIACSIMSKKLALGSDAIVLDIKCGDGAFMKNEDDASSLARLMTDIGRSFGKEMMAIVSGMDEPLGLAVGNALEVREAIETLKGKGPSDTTKISLNLAGGMIYLGGMAGDLNEGIAKAKDAMTGGKGLEKFAEVIGRQGGNPRVLEDPDLLPHARCEKVIYAEKDGYIHHISGSVIGTASMRAGAGRRKAEDEIDHAAGIVLQKKAGAQVSRGEKLLTVYANDEGKLEEAAHIAAGAVSISEEKPSDEKLIKRIIYPFFV